MFPRLKRSLPVITFVLITLLGWAGAVALLTAASRTETVRFTALVDEAANRIAERLRLHLLLIEATAAMFEAEGDTITAPRFATYFDNLRVPERSPGIAGLGFAALLRPGEAPAMVRRLEADYVRPIEVNPQTDRDIVVSTMILGSTDPGSPTASGFDMYSEPNRRATIDAAIAARAPRATEPVKLAADTAPLPGFIIYAPVYAADLAVGPRDDPTRPTGFAFGGFRIGELIGAALHVVPYLPVAMTVSDADSPAELLHSYGEAAPPRFGSPEPETRSLDVAGQTWTLAFRPSTGFQPAAGRPLALVFALISTALAAAVAIALREQARVRDGAEALAAAHERSLSDKDLLLQEMKHRIKNAIARILAIARQTAARADDLDAFTDSFTRRLQAMAEAQDMLTRSATASADLSDLLTRELAQVFGDDFDPARLRGPKIELDATRTQALGLVFHELATNALKYGGAADGPPAIDVGWSVTGGPGAPTLDLCWRERGGRVTPPEHVGFGTKLIDASLRHELGGRVERDWTPEGLSLRMILPLHAPSAAAVRPASRATSPGYMAST